MGHNFIQVGEEYDGGDVYAGVNSSPALLDQVSWKHWIEPGYPLREERLALAAQRYPWHDLAKGPYRVEFWSDGTFHDWLLLISASGMEVEGALEVDLDSKPLKWTSIGHLDRAFYQVSLSEPPGNIQRMLGGMMLSRVVDHSKDVGRDDHQK